MKSEKQDCLAMQHLMKFEVEAEKRQQEFTLAGSLKELGNILKKTSQGQLHTFCSWFPMYCYVYQFAMKR